MAGEFKVRKKKLGSYPFVSVVLSITLALFVIGVFGLLVIYSQELSRIVRENVRIQVYLKNHIGEEDIKNLEKLLATAPYTLKQNEKSSVVFISKEEAAKKFIHDTGEDFEKFLGENPLRNAFLVGIDPAFHEATKMAEIRKELEKNSSVFQVYYEENLIASVNRNLGRIGLVLLGIAGVLLIIVVLLINNTLRLALFSQRFLIRSMQLVGATRWFIQGPFLFRALLHGCLAGILSSGLLIGLIVMGRQRVEELTLIENQDRIVILLASLTAMGIFVAVVSTWRAVYKYLGLSLDELY